MRVELRRADHRYTRDDDPFDVDPWPSVTAALGVLPEYREAYRFATPYAKSLGAAVHEGCDLINKGRVVDPASIAPVVAPYLEAWRRLVAALRLKVHASELVVWHPECQYAGTLDVLASRRGGVEEITDLGDIKTSSPSTGARLAGPQTAAYLQARRLMHWLPGPALSPTIRRWSAHLAKDGTYRLVSHNDFAGDWFRFTEARKIWRTR